MPVARRVLAALGRIRVRLLIVNVVVLLVPIVGLEFARLYERQLLGALERDMRNQAVLVRRVLEAAVESGRSLEDPAHEAAVSRAALDTRTRIRVVTRDRRVPIDSHAHGPPEGPEREPPALLGASIGADWSTRTRDYTGSGERWPAAPDRAEVRAAFRGERATRTRVRERSPAVLLFLAEPVFVARRVVAVVYVVRSTQPVLLELYRIRAGLFRVLAVALVLTALLSLALAWSISRPLSRLSRAATRIARGERDVEVPIGGGGELRELGESFAAMTAQLDSRMRYISELSADVAHEFKSPLTSIRGAAELLGEGAADDLETRERFLHNIELDVDRLDRLVSRLLELSRIEAKTSARETVELAPLLAAVASRASTPEHAVLVELGGDDAGSLRVMGRADDLETALLNLCDNAVRFSPDEAPVRVHATVEDDRVVLRVTDEGPGVPEAHRERVFDRFFTTDAARDGTGLGLAIAAAVAHAHGGTLTLDPRGSSGACFVLRLPRLRR